ncbi:MAG: peptidoglycan editing factor PgeF, partial [Gammaproteobacteria bacterium]|nr:peptidoglycan editing factor PgeF [Gammaproteobacteria bacterium]
MSSGFEPDWPTPGGVRSWVTTRTDGVSQSPYQGLNLATHVGDREGDVMVNREALQQQLALSSPIQWLNQLHSTIVARLPFTAASIPVADGAWSDQAGVACAVLSADCLPILLTEPGGKAVAALHAGWRGLSAGMIQQGVANFHQPADQLIAWLGPAIGQSSYEVGDEVRSCFIDQNPEAEHHFIPSEGGNWLASMEGLARQQLQQLGVKAIYGGGWDTYSDQEQFFSYRRRAVTGRFATLIWIEEQEGE